MTFGVGSDQGEPEPFKIGEVRVSVQDDVSVMTLVGEIDISAAEDLEEARREVVSHGLPVQIDARRLDFIDSSGLGFLTQIIQTGPGGARPRLVGASPRIQDTLRIVGLADFVDWA